MKKEPLEEQVRKEMAERAKRYYRRQKVWELVFDVLAGIGFIVVLLLTMAAFAD